MLEYIPGDFVIIETESAKPRVVKVSTVDDSVIYCEGWGEVSFYDKIKPIPLTPEILEKNGWYGATHSKQSDDNTKILYKTFKRKGYPTIKVSQDLKITCELSPFVVKLESVSDLQHLLFGLNINHEMEV